MRIAYIAAGAGGMYCGSCIHDNTTAAAMIRRGHEVALIPTYTPMRTDEASVSQERLFYGGINVYLEQKLGLFRHRLGPLERLLDHPALVGWLSRKSASVDARDLGELSLSVLQGEEGRQAKELDKLVAWLSEEYRPELVHITNSMFLGLVRRLKQELPGVPVVVAVQGEDLFIDELPEPYRARVTAELRRRSAEADLFLAPNRYYAAHMARLLEAPEERFAVVPLGIVPDGHGEGREPREEETVVGYLARVAPEKGLHQLIEAFELLAAKPELEHVRLEVAGYLAEKDRPYLDTLRQRLAARGLSHRFVYHGEVDLAGKLEFLRSLDLLSVPTTYREAKGLFVLEALASGVPVVQPRHGSFPELVEATGGGLLVDAGSPSALAAGLEELIRDPARRRQLGRQGREAVHGSLTADAMAEATLEVYRGLLESSPERP